jgi:hypothetical protein
MHIFKLFLRTSGRLPKDLPAIFREVRNAFPAAPKFEKNNRHLFSMIKNI